MKNFKSYPYIFNGKYFVVAGGIVYDKTNVRKTERCTLDNNRMNCVKLASKLDSYWFYPYLLTVDNDFDENCN